MWSGYPNLAGDALTTILFHRFFFEGESEESSRDRLKRQCEWLRKRFTPVGLSSAIGCLGTGDLPAKPLLLTIDDAKIEILEVADIFTQFEIPIAIFACVGWCAQESDNWQDDDSLLSRLIADIEWYKGPARSLDTGWGQLDFGRGPQATKSTIDLILGEPHLASGEFEELHNALESVGARPRINCSWPELADLKSGGAEIGGHSVSHINLADASTRRMKFEIAETRRVLSKKFGACDAFAYPYGMSNTFSDATTQQLTNAGFQWAFLSHSDFADRRTDPKRIPRISLPDRPMSQFEFALRASGGGVVYRKLKHLIPRAA